MDPLVAATGGNPLALDEAVRRLTAEQRRGSAPLPEVLPVGERIAAAVAASLPQLTGGGRRALLLAAAAAEPEAAPVVAALRAEGVDPDTALAAAEAAGVLAVDAGTLAFTHPLVRAAVWQAAPPAERRSAHAALARVLADFPDREVRHRAHATTGYDEELAARLEELAARDRLRRGHAAASALQERAARLHPVAARAATARAAAVEDALLGGDVGRVRALAAEVLAGPADGPTRARVLLSLGVLEQYAGSVPRSRELLTEAAERGRGPGPAAGAGRAGHGQLPARLTGVDDRGRRRARGLDRPGRPDRPRARDARLLRPGGGARLQWPVGGGVPAEPAGAGAAGDRARAAGRPGAPGAGASRPAGARSCSGASPRWASGWTTPARSARSASCRSCSP